MLKYKKRIQREIEGISWIRTKDGKIIEKPTVQDVINNDGYLWYRNTSTPCSCSLCTMDQKYNRAKEKENFRKNYPPDEKF